jgi:tetratricopeptide (TPR) repeat protein
VTKKSEKRKKSQRNRQRRNKRRKQQSKGQTNKPSDRSTPSQIHLYQYEITYEPLDEPGLEPPPPHVQEALAELYDQVHNQPGQAIPRLLELIEKHPDIPLLYNYLAGAYQLLGETEKADEIIDLNYARNPNYLFGRIQYAERYLDTDEYEKIPEVFDEKYDLKMLYPERDVFHFTEVAAFMGLMGMYFIRKGDLEMAQKYDEILQQVAPELGPSQRLHNAVEPISPLEALDQLIKMMQSDDE